MRTYIIRRLLLMVPVVIGVSIIIFFILRAIPGDAIDAQLESVGNLSAEERAQAKQDLGLDKPIWRQYLIWAGDVLRGDFGRSYLSKRTVTEELRNRVPVTAELAVITIVIVMVTGVPIGIFSAARRDGVADYLARSISVLALSAPTFWIGIMILFVLSRYFQYFPPIGQGFTLFENPSENLQAMIFPALTLAAPLSAVSMRLTRSQMLEVLRQDYVRTAWAKGLREREVITRHALKNAMIPVITVLGAQLGVLLGGTVITEQVFTIPGTGALLRKAISDRDYPIVQAVILFLALVFVVLNLLVDLVYARLDPRIRYS
ncbi:MAG: ABC transporter permease [Chloroflexi bacterium]|nr:ABC transporter permease [Chloroflexota bacterium]